MPEQKLILTTVVPLLDGISDEGLLRIIRFAHAEFTDILSSFGRAEVSVLQIGDYEIRAVEFVDGD